MSRDVPKLGVPLFILRNVLCGNTNPYFCECRPEVLEADAPQLRALNCQETPGFDLPHWTYNNDGGKPL